jgi:predicted PurR-regulated permease PerM
MTGSRGHLTLLGVCTAILVLIAFYYARVVLAPVVFALFAIAVVWPLQSLLQARIPKLIAVATTVLVIVVVVTTLAALIGWGFGRATRWLLADLGRFQAMYLQAAAWLEQHGFVLTGVFGEIFNTSSIVAMVQRVGSRLQSTASFSVVALIFTILGLLEVDAVAAKLHRLSIKRSAQAWCARGRRRQRSCRNTCGSGQS